MSAADVVFIAAEGRDITAKKAYEREIARQREELAKLDVLKTQFFANISHEFRTPLTLMLGPLEDVLGNAHGVLPEGAASSLSTSHHNALRLLKLVNTMLDFSRIEAGRVRASYQPVDLASLTAELASNFHSLCDKAGLRLTINCAPLSPDEPAYVDRDMWEKIVLNLVSNAFKFTLEGEIEVRLEAADGHARLSVRDTGVGIPEKELPRMFERFHRIEHSRGRTYEGTGIGLALVQELVKLHAGTIAVASVAGEGSTFTVAIPLGKAHIDPDRVGKASEFPRDNITPAFVGEAVRWLRDDLAPNQRVDRSPGEAEAASVKQVGKARVLIADDNADMREYLRRVLATEHEVELVANGAAALNSLEHAPLPDLVLTDVMMPLVDGFELLRRLRDNERTRTLPVIMLSARAGEEARVEGLQAGADDYLVKPFTARELLAKVRSLIAMAQSRRAAELTIRAAQEHLRLALEASNLGTWDLDPQGQVLKSDARYKDIFGFPPDTEVTLAMALDRIHPDDRIRMQEQVELLLEADREREYNWNFRLLRPGGGVRWIAANAKAILTQSDAGDSSCQFVGTVRDCTEEKQSEESFRETQKLESLGLLAGGIAHDFNNLLTGVIGNASLLADELSPGSRQAEMVQGLMEAAERMSRLSSQMLAYPGRGHFVVEKVDLSRQVVQITSLLLASIPKHVQLRSSLANDLPPIDADISQLQQVIMNLVINAAEAIGASGGAVDVMTSIQFVSNELKGNVIRHTVPAGEYIVLTVKDTGCGMDEATCARIFDPFFTTKFTGRGLGLSSVLGIVRGHKGLLTVESTPGVGSTFCVFFPVAQSRPRPQPVPADVAGGEGAILVVDDEEIVLRVAQAALPRLGYRVLTAANGEEALRIYSSAPGAVDVVLLDLTMPVMGGEETLRRLIKIKPDVVVVVMSGFQERDVMSRFEGKVAGFIQKPFTGQQLGAALRAARETRATR